MSRVHVAIKIGERTPHHQDSRTPPQLGPRHGPAHLPNLDVNLGITAVDFRNQHLTHGRQTGLIAMQLARLHGRLEVAARDHQLLHKPAFRAELMSCTEAALPHCGRGHPAHNNLQQLKSLLVGYERFEQDMLSLHDRHQHDPAAARQISQNRERGAVSFEARFDKLAAGFGIRVK